MGVGSWLITVRSFVGADSTSGSDAQGREALRAEAERRSVGCVCCLPRTVVRVGARAADFFEGRMVEGSLRGNGEVGEAVSTATW